MTNNNSGPRSVLGGILRDILRFLGNLVGVCLVAGAIGTVAGLYMGLSFSGALLIGLGAIILVLAIFLVLRAGGDLF